MATKDVGTPPEEPEDIATKGYVDTAIEAALETALSNVVRGFINGEPFALKIDALTQAQFGEIEETDPTTIYHRTDEEV